MGAVKTFLERMKLSSALKSSSRFMEDRELHRLPMVYGTNQYFLTKDDMWVGFHIPHKNFGFLSFRRRQDYFTEAQNWFTNFPAGEENSGHILVVNHVQTAEEWEEALIKRQTQLADEEGREIPFGLVPYIRLSREAIDKQEFFRRDVFLFVKANDRSNFKSGIRGVFEMIGRQLTSGFGIDDSLPLEDEIKINKERARDLTASMRGGWVAPVPLRRSKVEWIIRYLDSLGQPTPNTAPEDEQEWYIGQWQTTMSSWTREIDLGKTSNNERVRAIEFITTTGEGRSYACFLPIASAPNQISPFANFLFNASTLPFPVDISLHFEVVDPVRAERELDRPINEARAQQMEEREAERDPDETTVAQRTQLEQVKTNTISNRQPLVFWQCVFAVYDSDPDRLKVKVAELKSHYESMQMKLTIPPMDQRPLFYQTFPGSDLLVKDWLQRTSPKYLASGMPWLNTNVGAGQDDPAFYQGYVAAAGGGGSVKAISPVFFDLVSVADVDNRAPTEFVCGDPGSGKQLPLDTLVPTPNGWTTMGELKIGDTIFDEQGNLCKVIHLAPIDHNPETYTLIFDDGSEIKACKDHRWFTETRAARVSKQRAESREYTRKHGSDELIEYLEYIIKTVDPDDMTTPTEMYQEFGANRSTFFKFAGKVSPVSANGGKHNTYRKVEFAKTMLNWCLSNPYDQSDKRELGSVKTTQEIFETLRCSDGRVNHSIPVSAPVQYSEQKLPCDPYVFGAWLGDGRTNAVKTTTSEWSTQDVELFELMVNQEPSLSFSHYQDNISGNSAEYYVTGLRELLPNDAVMSDGEWSKSGLRKVIPAEYLLGSVDQRVALLQGLMDTDGHVNKSGNCEFYQSDKELAEQVRSLIASLGMKASIRSKKGSYRNDEGELVECREAFTVAFSPSMQVFKLSRKASVLEEFLNERRTTTESRYIVDCVPSDSVPMRCITVDSDSKLFLVTDQYVPTHNTVSRGLKVVHENALKGITQFIWDPKGDFLPIHDNARELLLEKDKVQLIQLGGKGSEASISLDAFAIAEYNEEAEIDDRAVTAQDVIFGVCRGLRQQPAIFGQMIPDLVDYVIDEAERKTRQTGQIVNPKMLDLFEVLENWSNGRVNLSRLSDSERDAYRSGAHTLLKHLLTVRRTSLGKILFADPSKGSLTVNKGTTTIFNAINLKEVDPEVSESESVDDAVSRVIQEMMTSYIRSLLHKLEDEVTKAVFFDEWHVIRRGRAAERLLDWLKRMGRSKRTSVTYLSQSALDSGGGTLNSIWAGKCETEENARASCHLLQIEDTDENIKTLTGLGKGQFIYRDHNGDVALVQVDFWDSDVLELFNTQASAKAAAKARERKRLEAEDDELLHDDDAEKLVS